MSTNNALQPVEELRQDCEVIYRLCNLLHLQFQCYTHWALPQWFDAAQGLAIGYFQLLLLAHFLKKSSMTNRLPTTCIWSAPSCYSTINSLSVLANPHMDPSVICTKERWQPSILYRLLLAEQAYHPESVSFVVTRGDAWPCGRCQGVHQNRFEVGVLANAGTWLGHLEDSTIGLLCVFGDAFWCYQCSIAVHAYDEWCLLGLSSWFRYSASRRHLHILPHSQVAY